MANYLKIDFAKAQIIMDRAFAKNVSNTHSEEYAHLQEVRRDYPNFNVVMRTIKKNANKISYKGLTYDYMRWYIHNHGSFEKRVACLAEFEALIEISKCHQKSKRYPTIKKWFLETYPEIVKFGNILRTESDDYGFDDDIIEAEAEEIEYTDEPISA